MNQFFPEQVNSVMDSVIRSQVKSIMNSVIGSQELFENQQKHFRTTATFASLTAIDEEYGGLDDLEDISDFN